MRARGVSGRYVFNVHGRPRSHRHPLISIRTEQSLTAIRLSGTWDAYFHRALCTIQDNLINAQS